MIKKIVIGGTLTGIVTYLFGEIVFIYILDKLGPIITFFAYLVISLPISIWIYSKLNKRSISGNISKYFLKLKLSGDITANKWNRYLKASRLLAIYVSSIFTGVFVFAAIISGAGYDKQAATKLIIYDNIVFYLFWVILYSGLLSIWFKYILKIF